MSMGDTEALERTGRRLACVADIPANRGLRVAFDNEWIALFRKGDQVYAIDAVCPHAGALLDLGHFDGRIVYCPLHGWDFDVETGESPCYGIQTRRFPVEVRDGAVYLV
jgi:nitrite reductase (NADH) small subunit